MKNSIIFFFFSSRERHTRWPRDWSSDVCSSDRKPDAAEIRVAAGAADGSFFSPAGSTRRNPNFGSVRLRISDGSSWYKGLIAGASRRFSAGLALQASYTLGKSEDLGSQAVGSADFDNRFNPPYAFDPMDNRGLSDFDIRHNFAFNTTWEIPTGTLTGVPRAIAGGWQVSSIVAVR